MEGPPLGGARTNPREVTPMDERPNRPLGIAAALAGVLLLIVAVGYRVETAGALPSFLPGHEAGSTTHHVAHGIAAAVVALGLFAFAWFTTTPARPGQDR